MSGITHRLVGYDRATERVVDEYPVPDDKLDAAKTLAHVPTDDPEAALCYPLRPAEAKDLAGFIGASNVKPERCDYFLEGFAAD
jgi:hypothetical protein